MTEKPLVSVIINCYNGEKYLREAIDSVIAQTYENWELVFWDNQSTDSTREIVENYHNPKIHYYYASEHTPLGEARNLAVEKANGEYINFLDADDVWMPEKLEKQIALVEPGKVEVVYTGFTPRFEGKSKAGEAMYHYYEKVKSRKPKDGMSIYQYLLIHNFIIFSTVLFNKKLFLAVGGIDGRFNQNEDYDILLKCSLKTDFATTGVEEVIYRVHDSNNSSKNGMSYILENRIILNELPDSIDVKEAKKRNEIRCAIYYIREHRYLKGAWHFLKHGSIWQFIKLVHSKRETI